MKDNCMDLSLVIPAHNEEKTLLELVKKVQKSLGSINYDIVIVNDGSTDKTLEIATKLSNDFRNISCLSNDVNIGKSQTVRKGILATTGNYVVIQDADLEYEPSDLLLLYEKISRENLDIVYGNRFGYNNKVVYWKNWFGNTFLSLMSSLITGLRAGMWVRDMEVCYKIAKGELFRDLAINIESKSNFGFEPEITAKFSKVKGLKFAQMPIKYYPRTLEEGKHMNAFRDGFKALKEILYFNFR